MLEGERWGGLDEELNEKSQLKGMTTPGEEIQ